MSSASDTITMHIPEAPSYLQLGITGVLLLIAVVIAMAFKTTNRVIVALKAVVIALCLVGVVASSMQYYYAAQRHDEAVNPPLSKILNSYGLTEYTEARDGWSGTTFNAYMNMEGKKFYRCNVLTHIHGSTNDVKLACEDKMKQVKLLEVVHP